MVGKPINLIGDLSHNIVNYLAEKGYMKPDDEFIRLDV